MFIVRTEGASLDVCIQFDVLPLRLQTSVTSALSGSMLLTRYVDFLHLWGVLFVLGT